MTLSPLLKVHIATVLFGLAGLFAVTTGLGAMVITFGRTAFAALTLLLIAFWLGGKSRLTPDSYSVGSGVLLAVHWSLFFWSIQLSNVALGLIMFTVSAVFISLLEPVVFKEKFRRTDVICAVVVVIGIVIIVGSDKTGDNLAAGVVIGLASSIVFALLQLMNRALTQARSAMSLSMIQNSVACMVLLPFVIGDLGNVSVTAWLQLLFLGCVCTAFAHTIFISALREIKATLAGLISGGLEPVYGAVLAAVLLLQYPGMNVLIGGVLVVLSVVWAQRVRLH